MSHQTIKVNLDSGSYPVYIGRGLLKAKSLLTRHIRGHQVMIVTQKSIAKYYLKHLLESLNAYQCDVIYIAPGEKNKSIASWNIILNGLINKKHERTTTIIALGGGIVGDVAGFAAACYLRGVSLIQIPTTLIAQVDSSVGGKTGVNHRYGKNLIGAFYQPQCVLIDTLTLNTLPEREYVSGLAEIIKYGLIQNKRFFSWLEKNATALLVRDQAALQKAIQYSVKAKAAIVAQDEYEQNGIRSLLNFGHTAGHALEKISDYQLLHGEAVAIGI
ncbi:MAG TPA: 3-dehydroquinate synthase, partial [Gammaproteobacteria bacterium]|nr:3-dehydroquinate synthase [Gammaproteobacteria bacterium]